MAQDTPRERVLYIAQLMSDNLWPEWPDTDAKRKELAAMWGLSESSIRAYATEAHRLLTLDKDDLEQLRMALARRMKRIADDAETRLSKVTGLPDYGSAIKAINDYSKFAGLDVDAKPEPEKSAPVTIQIVYPGDMPDGDEAKKPA